MTMRRTSTAVATRKSDPAAQALANLAAYAEQARGALSPNTERAIRADTATFTAWCSERGARSLPAKPATVADFIDAMADQKAPATVRRYVSSIAHMHRAARAENPTTDSGVTLALKRLHREKGRAQAQATGLTRPLVDRIMAATGNRLLDLRNRALLAVAYDTLCRRSELVTLQRADLEIAPQGDGTVAVRRSKTDQEGAGAVAYLAPDTMQHLAAWLNAAKVTDGALFRAVSRAGVPGGPLSAGDVAVLFKGMAEAAHIQPAEVARISGHSSRVGAAQDMVRHGVELPAIMQSGRWKTAEMVSRYTRRLDARRGGAAKLARAQDRA